MSQLNQSDLKKLEKNRSKAIVIFILAASFYLYEYILQVAPSVMSDEIMRTFNVGAAGLGTISAFYFYAYAPMQLPAGLLFDCYGPRRLITAAILFCSCGAVFFALTNSLLMASLGRFFIGIGSAFSFIGILVLISRWFKPAQFALMAGIAQMGSSLGAIFGEFPLAKLAESVGWRQATFILSGIGVFLALLVWCIVRDTPYTTKPSQKTVSVLKEWRRLLIVMHHPQTWMVGLYAFCSWTPIAIFAALWGVPYLVRLYDISTAQAAMACSLVWIAIGIGSPLLGWFSDKIENRRYPLMLAMLFGVITSLGLIFLDKLPFNSLYFVLFFFGLSASGQTLSFAVVKENNRPEYVGSASGFNNLSVLIGGAIFQPVFGLILYANWQGKLSHNMPVYSISAYKTAMLMLPVFHLIGLLTAYFLIKEPKRNY